MNHYRITVEPVSEEAITQYGETKTFMASGFVLGVIEELRCEGMSKESTKIGMHVDLAGTTCVWNAFASLNKVLRENFPEEYAVAMLRSSFGDDNVSVVDGEDSGSIKH